MKNGGTVFSGYRILFGEPGYLKPAGMQLSHPDPSYSKGVNYVTRGVIQKPFVGPVDIGTHPSGEKRGLGRH